MKTDITLARWTHKYLPKWNRVVVINGCVCIEWDSEDNSTNNPSTTAVTIEDFCDMHKLPLPHP